MRRFLLLGWVFGLVFVLFSAGVQAQDKYPNRAIELVVPMDTGGTADVIARAYSDNLAKLLNVPVTVVNRAGGTGIQGTTYVIRSKKDGYTLLASTDTPLMVMPVISKEVSYDPLKDVIPLGHIGYATGVIAVRNESPFKTLEELVDFARKNPGKLKNSASGIGTESFFNLQLLCQKEKIKIVTIPFKSGGEVMTSLLGGHTDMSSSSIISLGPQLKAGGLRGLAVSTKKRHPDYPNIPTTAEAGYPDVNLNVWLALFAPSGVPKQVVDVLMPAVEKVFKDPEVVKRALNAGLVVEYLGPQETRNLLESGMQIIRKLAPEAGLIK
jgi:tripartite-type tricarboxylate transporter receptor subunit TctC